MRGFYEFGRDESMTLQCPPDRQDPANRIRDESARRERADFGRLQGGECVSCI